MPDPAPLLLPWRGAIVRVRHDDPRLTPHSPRAAVIIAAAQLATSEAGLLRVLQATVGEWYAVSVRAEPLAVGLRRLPAARGPPDQPSLRTRVQEPSWSRSGSVSVAGR